MRGKNVKGYGENMIDKNKINITAHAGCMGRSLDSVKAMEIGIKYGANIIEIDLNIDSSKKLILSHDAPKVECIYESFETALEILKNKQNILLNIDVKNTEVLKYIKNVILKFELLDRVFLTGLTYKDIISNKEFLEDIYYFINLDDTDIKDKNYKKIINEIKSENFLGININYKFIDVGLVSFIKENNILVAAWTVDDTYEMERLIKLNVNSITTNRVDILRDKLIKIQ